jgi:hypothetical protein
MLLILKLWEGSALCWGQRYLHTNGGLIMPNFDSNESEDCSNCTMYGPCDRHREPDRIIDTRPQETEEEVMARHGYAYVNGEVKFVGTRLNKY